MTTSVNWTQKTESQKSTPAGCAGTIYHQKIMTRLGTADHVSVSGGDGRWLWPSIPGLPAETSSISFLVSLR
ncbi:MAG: hypothetical protein JNL58_21280 [Planctomyces sp.]|nr:hypothetical protein [Planctomyces sp.]